MNIVNIKNRIRKIEKALTPRVNGRCYLDIWIDLTEEQWNELVEWAVGFSDERPDFWPSEERASELRQQGYFVKTRDELRVTFEICAESNRSLIGIKDGIDWRSINGTHSLNSQEAV